MLNSEYSINLDWLKYIAGEISKGNITITKAAENAYVDTQFGSLVIQIPESTLRLLFNKNSISYFAKVGRPKKTISSEIENIILYFQSELNSGETVTCHSVRAEYPQITSHDVHEVFIKFNLFQYKKDTEKPKTRCRYEALYVMQIWHADIHTFTDINQQEYYLYAIIDDRSRFIVGAEILKNKSQLETIRVLNAAINQYGSPAIMWTDNGGENNGNKMLRFLESNRIYPHFTFPRNPQQNGKIESFWKKIDKNCKMIQDIPKYIEKYNYMRAHTGLEKTKNGNFKRPKDVFYDPDLRWQRTFPWKYLVDGQVKPFPYKRDTKIKYYD